MIVFPNDVFGRLPFFLSLGVWVFFFFSGSLPVHPVILRVLAEEENTIFYGPPEDTVLVVVLLDSEGEILTGVEVFLKFDPRIFQALDSNPASGFQPAEAGLLLKELLADTLIVHSDSLALVHYAEADLTGQAVSGSLFTVPLIVVGRISGTSKIEVYRDSSSRFFSAYTIPTLEGRTFELDKVGALVFQDLPPVLSLPTGLKVEEDGVLSLYLDSLATDVESSSNLLGWRVNGPDSLLEVVLTKDRNSSLAVLTPVNNFNGSIPILFEVVDPSGGKAISETSLLVLPVNDPPHIFSDLIPDTLLLSKRTYKVSLEGAGKDLDNHMDSLVWNVEVEGSVKVRFEAKNTINIFARVDWTGREILRLKLTDSSGASDTDSILVYRDLPIEELPGDFNGDGLIDFSDFLAFVKVYGKKDASVDFDLDGNSQVDFFDFLIFSENFGRTSL